MAGQRLSTELRKIPESLRLQAGRCHDSGNRLSRVVELLRMGGASCFAHSNKPFRPKISWDKNQQLTVVKLRAAAWFVVKLKVFYTGLNSAENRKTSLLRMPDQYCTRSIPSTKEPERKS